MSPDRLGSTDPRAPQTWNRYSYGRSNPLAYLDRDGESATLALAYAAGKTAELAAFSAASAAAGTVVLVAGTGAGVYYLGLQANDLTLPSGQRIGDWVSDALSGLFFAQSPKAARGFIDKKIATILEHIGGRYPSSDPNDPDKHKRKGNIYRKMMGQLKDAFDEVKDLGGRKQQEEALRRLLETQKELQRWWHQVP